ncbi:MAG: uridine phosphorylase [Clostridiales bacterium]|nr:uridine phosphorylase [Clostridiales bacterium]
MGEKLYHIQLCREDLQGARYAILPGDPGRVPLIAAQLSGAVPLAQNREYTSWLGELEGERVAVVSTGIGGPSAAICIEELAQLGVDTLVRVGTCGGMQLEVKAGDVIVASAAIRMEGTSREYLPIEFPAVADFAVTAALKREAEALGIDHHVGVVQCKDSFYGQHSPARMPVSYELQNKWAAWVRGGALGSEMETAALFTVCSALRLRAGAVLMSIWNQERERAGLPQEHHHDTERAVRVAVGAVARLIRAAREGV